MFRILHPKLSKASTIRKCDNIIQELETQRKKTITAKKKTDSKVYGKDVESQRANSPESKTRVVKVDFTPKRNSFARSKGHPACGRGKKDDVGHAALQQSANVQAIDESDRSSRCAPSADAQRRYVSQLDTQDRRLGLVVGDTRFVVDEAWWNAWTRYVAYRRDSLDGTDSRVEEKRGGDPRGPPGPITNQGLLSASSTSGDAKEQRSVVRGRPFVVVSREVWSILSEWYGGGPAIPRRVVRTSDGGA